MTTKRTPLRRDRRAVWTPELHALAVRLLELSEAHLEAIRGNDPAFYTDGRRDEMHAIGPEVRALLAIKPWHDQGEILREFIAMGEARG